MFNALSSEIAPTGEHRLLKRGDLNLFEVERVDRTVIELSVRWDKTVLRVVHLAWGQGFCLARDGVDGEDRLVVGPSLMPEETQAFSLIGWGEVPVFRAPPGARIERADEGAGAPCDPSGDDALSMRAERMREIPLRFGTHPCVRMSS